jgi:predicted metal-dependent peptidase
MDEYAQWLRNPFDPPAKMAHLNPMHSMKKSVDPGYQHPADNHPPLYFSDANLQGDMRRPEFIYSHLLSQIPKCKVCGKLGKYEKPDEYKELERHLRAKEDAEKAACIDKNCDKHDHSPEHTHTDDCKDKCTHQQCDCEKDGGDYYNGGGDLVDDHYDFDISEDEMGKRLQNAVDQSRRLGGKVGAGIEDELDALISPKLSYKDFILSKLHNIRTGSGRCDWSSPKTKPLFLGVYQPKRVNRFAKFVCLVDTSGSMGSDDLVLGISQIQSLDSRGEGTIACFDTKFYPESVVKLRSANATELSKTKIIGRGGSMITDALKRYEEYCGKPNLLIIISDSGLVESIDEINAALPTKGTEVMWLITQPNKAFKPNGRVFHLRD